MPDQAMRRRLLVLLCAAGISLGAAGPLDDLRVLDVRLIDVGTRLAVANAALCEDRQWQAGMTIHDLSQYAGASRPQAAASFGLTAGPGVLALAPSGAAARAGIRLDDIILAADGAPLPPAPRDPRASFAPAERIVEALEAALADGVAALTLRRGGAATTVRIEADPGCASRFQLLPSPRLEARADGRYVQLTSAMAEFARDDQELAALVAHELAHNILKHRRRLNAAGVDRGLLAPFGRSGRLFRQTELEADRLAVHLLARAGFDPAAAVRLWTRQSRVDSRLFAGTHPDWPARIAALEDEIAALAAGRPAPIPRGPLRAGPG